MITVIQPPYQLAKLTSLGPLGVDIVLGGEGLGTVPMTEELQELFESRDHLYFEVIFRDGILTLHKNVSPP